MHKSLPRLTPQISCQTGKPYNHHYSELLAKFNFPSSYWISEIAMKRFGLKVKEGEVKNAVRLDSNRRLYNASQTVDPAKVESLSGKFSPTFALGGSPLLIGRGKPLVSSGENKWVTKNQIKKLGLSVRPSVESAISIMFDGTKRTETVCFPLEGIVERKSLQRALRIRYVNSSGIPYQVSIILPLVKDTMRKGFTSGYWITLGQMRKLGASLNPGELPTTLKMVHQNLELYNVDQLVDKTHALEVIREREAQQISGLSGFSFPKALSDFLGNIVKEHPEYTRYWLTYNQATKLKSVLPGESPISFVDNGFSKLYYNAAQLKPFVMNRCVIAHKRIV
ncbi:mitochondrial RNA-binding protein RBP38 [Perkinsela sp. CCAP 1560/4]|nr:mitochondrial RNA-binding protein RBP38 [Perkinsela sp. CCAP 1560/4]|eukprot:KNH05906.1 mitochondrial RNA-binding protein RBP38 [Perkinsela sp. CCAP 1560/4]